MADRAYGVPHRRRREYLLLATPDGSPCPICLTPLDLKRPDLLELHHSDPAAKAAGLPGDVLCHKDCNRAMNRPVRQRPTRNNVPSSRPGWPASLLANDDCEVCHGLWNRRQPYPGEPATSCAGCGGYLNARTWPEPGAPQDELAPLPGI